MRVQGNEEQVRALDLLKPSGRVAGARHDVAERRAHALQNRRLQEEAAQGRGLIVQHLVQVIADLAVVSRELLDECASVLLRLHGESCQAETRGPALGARQQELHLATVEVEPERIVEERLSLGVTEAELGCPHLGDPAGRPEARQRQRRIGAARDRQMHVLR